MTQAQLTLVISFTRCEQEHMYGAVTLGNNSTLLINNAPDDDSWEYKTNDYFIDNLIRVHKEVDIKAISLTTPTKTLTIKCA